MSSLEVHRCQERAPPEVVSELAAALVQEAVEKGGPRGVRAGCARGARGDAAGFFGVQLASFGKISD